MLAILPVVFLLFFVSETRAQTAAPARSWDVAIGTGVFANHPTDAPAADTYDDWYTTATLAITAGRYLTPHLKAEAEVTLSREGSRYVQPLVDVPGLGLRPFSGNHLVRTNSVSGALVWQFFENQWVHPFLMAGVALDFDRARLHTEPQPYYVDDPRGPGFQIITPEERFDDLGTTRTARGLLGAGAKMYVGSHTFFRGDTRIGIGPRESGHVAFRLGFGIDF